MSSRAQMLIRMGRYDQAEKEVQNLLASDPEDVEAFFLLGVIESHRNRPRKAE